MLYKNAERPDGRSRGQPEVLVCHDTIAQIGMPVVNYDLLDEFSRGIIGNPSIRHPRMMIHTMEASKNMNGFYYGHTNTVHADAVQAEQDRRSGGGVIEVLAHELGHFADFKNNPLKAEVQGKLDSLRYGAYLLTNTIAHRTMGYPPPSRTFHQKSSIERQASERQKPELLQPYLQAVLFPNSLRTERMLHDRQLTVETIGQLGLGCYEHYGSDYKSWFESLVSRMTRK